VSTFENTVQRLAANPRSRDMLRTVPAHVVKTAAPFIDTLFGVGKETKGWQNILKDVTGGALLAGAVGAGTIGASQLEDKYLGGGEDRALNTEQGKIQARSLAYQAMLKELEPQYAQVLQQALQDEVISDADPELIKSSYETMRRFAPILATDLNATRSFLRETASYGTGPSYAALKNLADTEQAIQKATGASFGAK